MKSNAEHPSNPLDFDTPQPFDMSTHASRKRTDMACSLCRQRKIKCESNKPHPCRHCKEKGKECQYIPVAEDALVNTVARTTPPSAYPSHHPQSSPKYNYSPTNSPHHARSFANDSSYVLQTNSVGHIQYGIPSPVDEQVFDTRQDYTQASSSSYYQDQYTDPQQPYQYTGTQSFIPTAEVATGVPSPVADTFSVYASQSPRASQASHLGHNNYNLSPPHVSAQPYGYVPETPVASPPLASYQTHQQQWQPQSSYYAQTQGYQAPQYNQYPYPA